MNGIVGCALFAFMLMHGGAPAPHSAGSYPLGMRGIWAECEGVNATLSRRSSIEEMIGRLETGGFNTLFLQVYRGSKAWYRSDIADATPYREFRSAEHGCPLRVAIDSAHRRGIEVHAWVNIFRVWGERGAKTLRTLGKSAVTCDRSGRSMLGYAREQLPDGGYWLDPGDPAARDYALSIIREILDRYPDIDGIHLDYVRYPFDEKGRTDFGYAGKSVSGFRIKHGVKPGGGDESARRRWDDWRRAQVTAFVAGAKRLTQARGKKLSAAVIPDERKSLSVAFQDWRRWLREGLVDFVVPMNYGSRREAVRRSTEAVLRASGGGERVAIGLGAYKVLDSPPELLAQIGDCRRAGAAGVVLFSYDNMSRRPDIFPCLGKKAFGARGDRSRSAGGANAKPARRAPAGGR